MISLRELLAKVMQQLPPPLQRLPAEWRRRGLRQATIEKFTEADPAWTPEEKVFGIGLSRTGTTSLARALDCLGYKSFHFSRSGKVLGWPEFYDVEAATDIPCSAQFEALYHTFEESKFIYTVRDIDRWTRSMKKHTGVDRPPALRAAPTTKSYWTSDLNWGWYNQVRRVQFNEALYTQHRTWEEAYQAHDRRVRRFFANKPDRRFLEMEITGSQRPMPEFPIRFGPAHNGKMKGRFHSYPLGPLGW